MKGLILKAKAVIANNHSLTCIAGKCSLYVLDATH